MRGGLGGGDQIYCCRFVRKSPEEQPGRREEICYLINLLSLQSFVPQHQALVTVLQEVAEKASSWRVG